MSAGVVTVDDGCGIAYQIDGDAGAPVLVLSNSLGTSMAMWEAQMPLFTQRYRVLRYETRGHGTAVALPGPYSIDRLGRDALAVLEALHVDTFHFCGLSLGGMVGQWFGYHLPDRLRSLILANTSAYMGPSQAWQARIDNVREGGMEAIADAVIERWFTPEFRAGNADRVHSIARQLLHTSPAGYIGCCAAIRDMDQRAPCSLIKARTLIIAGARDPATPIRHAEFLAHTIPNARLAILETAHLSNVERPDDFGRLVCHFLGELDGRLKA